MSSAQTLLQFMLSKDITQTEFKELTIIAVGDNQQGKKDLYSAVYCLRSNQLKMMEELRRAEI